MITKITPSTRHSVALTVRDGRRAVIRMPGRQGAAGVSGGIFVRDEFAASAGQGVFALSAVPLGTITWSLNGVTQGANDAVISSQSLHLSNADAALIEAGDKVIISYVS